MNKLKTKHNPKIIELDAIGTHWFIELYDMQASSKNILIAIRQRIEQFDCNYSRFRLDSLVSTMSVNAGQYVLPSDAKPMLDLYRELYELTSGQLTPLIGQTLSDAGYDAQYSFKSKPLHKPPAWKDSMDYDFPKLRLMRPALLDFGALGKGYLIDIIGGLLQENGIGKFLINAGGDMLYRGQESIEIGLEHPENVNEAIGVFNLQSQALCASAGNRRSWGEYHHIINPTTLASPQDIRAVWACAETAMLADGLATALFFTSAELLLKRYTFSYALLYQDYSISYSDDFSARFFTPES